MSDLSGGVQPGDILAGKYRVEHVLGAGGMGVVVAAHHVQLESKVAIKFLLPHMLRNAEAVTRFAREAKAAVRITSEHVARVFDVGTLDTGAPYIVMEFLEGGDLAAWLTEKGPLPIEQAVEFILQASVALAEAHGLGIIHRDLKPANLFWIRRADGQLSIKVLDFGISKLTDLSDGGEGAGSVTKTSAIMGSPLYMSPEQMRSTKTADAQSDIWALGVILYELVTGNVPFTGQSAMEIAINAATVPPDPPRKHRPELAPGLEAVILKCLEKDRKTRYRNVAELAAALAEFAPNSGGSVERIRRTLHSSSGLPPAPATGDVATNPTLLSGNVALAASPGGAASQPAVVAITAGPVGRTLHEVPTKRARGGFGAAAIGIAAALVVGGSLAAFALSHGATPHAAAAASSSTPVSATAPSSAPGPSATPPPEAQPAATPTTAPTVAVPVASAPVSVSMVAPTSAPVTPSHASPHVVHPPKTAPAAPAAPPSPQTSSAPPPKAVNPLSMQPM
jgi:serine/threonine protein kinase